MIPKAKPFLLLTTVLLCQTWLIESEKQCRSCRMGGTRGVPLPGIFLTEFNHPDLPEETNTCNDTTATDVKTEPCDSPCLQGFFYMDYSRLNQNVHLFSVFVRTCGSRLLDGYVANWDKKTCGEIKNFDLDGQKLNGRMCLCQDGDKCNNDDIETIQNFPVTDACSGNRCKEGSYCTPLTDQASYKCGNEPVTRKSTPSTTPRPTRPTKPMPTEPDTTMVTSNYTDMTSAWNTTTTTTTTTTPEITTVDPNGAGTQKFQMFWLALLAVFGALGSRLLFR